MKKLLNLLIYFLLLAQPFMCSVSEAVTEFKATIKPSGGDYTTFSGAENGLDHTGACDLTSSSYLTAPYDGAVGDPTAIIDGEAVTWDSGVSTGNMVHVTTVAKSGSTTFFINVTGGTLDDDDVIDDGDGNTITVNGTPDTAQISMEISGDWTGVTDTTAVTITGWTTDSDNYISIYTTGDARHDGIYGNKATAYKLETSGTVPITISAEYVKIDGLQIKVTANGSGDHGINLTGFTSLLNGGLEISNNIIVGVYSSTYESAYGVYCNFYATGSRTVKIWNNVIYDFINADYTTLTAIWARYGWVTYIYNNTVYNSYNGVYSDAATTAIAKNNISIGNTDNYKGIFNATSTHNLTGSNATDGAWGVAADSGTTDGVAASKLIDAGQNFLTTVEVGMIVKNTTDTTYTYITAVDSDEQLSINDDIFISGENYTIYTNRYATVTFVAAGTDFHLDPADAGARNFGTDLSGDGSLPFNTDIDGATRPGESVWDIGADEYTAVVSDNYCGKGVFRGIMRGVMR